MMPLFDRWCRRVRNDYARELDSVAKAKSRARKGEVRLTSPDLAYGS
jgi:hypothetical protein